jgi:hypothetical protein
VLAVLNTCQTCHWLIAMPVLPSGKANAHLAGVAGICASVPSFNAGHWNIQVPEPDMSG